MPMPVLATKLYIPSPQPKVLLRSRLIERLQSGLTSGHKLILISAPAGFGKTTLISEWIAYCERLVAWLSLDEGDSDLTRFLTYFIAALQTLVAGIGDDLLGALQSPQLPSTEPLLTALINEIAATSGSFILVLDDYRTVESEVVDRVVTFLVDHLPPLLHLVISSRVDPPIPLARLRVRRQLTELRAADLRFTPIEAFEFLNHMMELGLSAEDLEALENRTEGWIAGLQLAALSLQGNQDAHAFIQSFTGTHHFVLDYLLEEVLQKQPESTQAFLLRTSILNRLCASLCDALLSDAAISSQEILEYLARTNLFINSLDDERRWYRYHQLFGDLLRQRMGQYLRPEEIAAYHIRASEWYEKNGDESEAFRHAITAGNFSRAAGLAESAWRGMNESFQSAAWLGWIRQLPENVIRTRPVLCTQIGWAFMDAGNVDASESRLRDAERCMAGPSEEMVVVEETQFRALPARIAFARAYNAMVVGDLSATVKYGQQAFSLAPEEDPFIRAQARAFLATAYWAKGELETASNAMRDWMENSQKSGNFIFSIASATGLADILIAQGRLEEAVRTYQQSLQVASEHGKEAQRITAHHHLGLAILYHEMGNDAAAAQYVQRALELGPQTTLVDWQYRKCLAQARLKESEGDLDTALELLDEARRLYVKTPIPDTRPVEALKARIYLKQGRLSKAWAWVHKQGLAVDGETSYLREFEHITLARTLIAEYQANREERFFLDALRLLERLLAAAEEMKRMGSVLEILITQALAYNAQGNIHQALTPLRRALALAEPEGYSRLFIDEGKAMARLLYETLSEDFEPAYIRRLLAGFPNVEQEKTAPSKGQADLIEALSDRELEVLRLIAEGLSNQEIAEKLYLSLHTVKIHARNIYGKLDVNSRTQAVARGKTLGILNP